MLITHIFLLNVLIAVMSRTMSLESKEAHLHACYRQTNLVLDEEVEMEAATRAGHHAAAERYLYARWLHVLLPAEYHQEAQSEHAIGGGEHLGGGSVPQQLGALHADVQTLLAAVKQQQQHGGGGGHARLPSRLDAAPPTNKLAALPRAAPLTAAPAARASGSARGLS